MLVLGAEPDAVDAGTVGQDVKIARHALVLEPDTRSDLVVVDVNAPDQIRPRVGEEEDGWREGDAAVQGSGLGRKGQYRDGFRWLGEREGALVQAVQDGVVVLEHVATGDVEDVGLGRDDAHGVLVESVQQDQEGRSFGGKLVLCWGSRRWRGEEVKGIGAHHRVVGAEDDVLEEVTRWKRGDRRDFGRRHDWTVFARHGFACDGDLKRRGADV